MPRGWWKAVPGGVARHCCGGVWCQGLLPPRPPVLWGGQSGFHDPGGPVCGWCGRGDPARAPLHAPLRASVVRCGGGGKGVPGGGAFRRCKGRLGSGTAPPPAACSPGGLSASATHVLWAWVCECGGPALSPWLACPAGAACREGCGGPSLGGMACHRFEGRLVSGAVPPTAARALGWAAGVPRPVGPWCGRCGRGDLTPAPQRAPLRAGVARFGGGGRASPGGSPFTIVRGV